jgi:hypothetical protein
MTGCEFECRLYRTAVSDLKWSRFGPEMKKDYRINTCKMTYFHNRKQYEQKII